MKFQAIIGTESFKNLFIKNKDDGWVQNLKLFST